VQQYAALQNGLIQFGVNEHLQKEEVCFLTCNPHRVWASCAVLPCPAELVMTIRGQKNKYTTIVKTFEMLEKAVE
jgi:hypothetical protein